jgi:hypothetical protein
LKYHYNLKTILLKTRVFQCKLISSTVSRDEIGARKIGILFLDVTNLVFMCFNKFKSEIFAFLCVAKRKNPAICLCNIIDVAFYCSYYCSGSKHSLFSGMLSESRSRRAGMFSRKRYTAKISYKCENKQKTDYLGTLSC